MKKKIGSFMGLLLTVGLLVPVVLAAPASAADPDNVSVTLEGCRLGTFHSATNTCDDADYTTGNLQPGWNEFDLVPHRLTLKATNAAPGSQQYVVGIAFDSIDAGIPGYDRILDPVLNTALSDESATNCTFSFTGTLSKTPGIGGTDTTIYRLLTITQQKNTTCVYDTAARLAIGSSGYSGSSLHANATDANVDTAGIGARDVSLPVTKQLLPQEISKDISGTRDSAVDWDITKEAQPASLDFKNVCNTNDEELSTTVDVTVNWENKGAVDADTVSVTTHVYATNPSHRSTTVNITDTATSGANQLFTFQDNNNVVPANTTLKIVDDTRDVPANLVVNNALHNEADATYFDTVFNEPVPGQTSAEADGSVTSGTVANETVDITDTESLTGDPGLSFSVDTPSVGDFTNGYVANTQTTGPVDWGLDDVSATGSVTFEKTVYLAAGTGAATGTLSDTATLTLDDSTTKTAGPLDISISSSASGSFTVNKTTSVPVDKDTTFVFEINPGGIPLTVDIAQGGNSGTGTVSGLALGDYTLTETSAPGFTLVDPIPFSIALGDCDITKPVLNTFSPATAQVQKVVNGSEDTSLAGFEFTLFKDIDPAGVGPEDTVSAGPTTTDATGLIDFGEIANEGNYYVLETDSPDGFIDNGGDIGCAFTVDYPADAGTTFSCTWTNTLKATAEVAKVTDPKGFESGWHFELFKDNDPAGAGPEDTSVATADTTGTGAVNFGVSLDEGSYYIVETPQTGWESGGASSECTFTVDYPADAGRLFSCTFTNTAKGSIGISKTGGTTGQVFVFELRQGAATLTTPGTLLDTENVTSGGATVKFKINNSTDLPFGNYNICEILQVGWSNNMPNQYNLALPDNEIRVCTDVSITVANQDLTLSVVNTPPPGGERGTLGYWKNHSSCKTSNGKQAFILDQTLALFPIASGQTTHGFFVGDLYVDTCTEAYRLLDKTSVTNANKKYASDPAFTFAAQYVAAVLNIKAGAAPCAPTVPNAINQGQALLDLLNFNGVAPPTYASGAAGAQQKTTLLQLAATLDTYNNGGIC